MHNHHQGPGHRFNDIERLRSPEWLARLEIDRVAELAFMGLVLHETDDLLKTL